MRRQEEAKARVIRLHGRGRHPAPIAAAGYVTLVGVPLRRQQHLLGEVNLYFGASKP